MVPTEAASDNETVLADLELTRGLAIQLAAVGTLGFFVALAGFGALYQAGTGRAATFAFGPAGVGWWNRALDLLVLLVLATAVVLPHEWVHGLAFRYYGGEPRYGVGVAHFVFPYAYATSDHRFSRNQFLVVLLAPLVALTLVGAVAMLVLEWGWLVVPLAANAGGAVADVWMAATLFGYLASVSVEDHSDGVRIVGRERHRPRTVSVTAAVWDALAGAAVATVALLLLVGVGGPFVLSALGVDSLAVGTPGTLTHVFTFVNTPEEISVSVGAGVPILGAVVGLSFAFVRSYRRRVDAAPRRAG